jgi:hypothetical protein
MNKEDRINLLIALDICLHKDIMEDAHKLIENYERVIITKYEVSRWKKYPENIPNPDIMYLFQDKRGHYWIIQGKDAALHYPTLIAFQELPKQYKEGNIE